MLSKAPAIVLMPPKAPSKMADVTAPRSDVLVLASSRVLLYASSATLAVSVVSFWMIPLPRAGMLPPGVVNADNCCSAEVWVVV